MMGAEQTGFHFQEATISSFAHGLHQVAVRQPGHNIRIPVLSWYARVAAKDKGGGARVDLEDRAARLDRRGRRDNRFPGSRRPDLNALPGLPDHCLR